MIEITLSKCLSKLDTIIFSDVDNYKNELEIRQILNDTRIYIIDSIEDKKKYNKKSFRLILEFINFLIQESYEPITHLFNKRISRLRFLIIRFKDNRLLIGNQEIDFEKDCDTFSCNIINNNGHDYSYNQDDDFYLYK